MSAWIVLGFYESDVPLIRDILAEAIKRYRTTYPIRYDMIRETQRLMVQIDRQHVAYLNQMKELKQCMTAAP